MSAEASRGFVMGNEMDEDRIQATIRRVAEERAARSGGATAEDFPAALDEPDPAAGDDGSTEAERVEQMDRVESVMRRLAEAKSHAPAPPDAENAGLDLSSGDDDDLIEQTIRRVAAAKAAQARTDDDQDDPEPAVEAAPLAIAPVELPAERISKTPMQWPPQARPAAPGASPPAPAAQPQEIRPAALEAAVAALQDEVASLTARVAALESRAPSAAPERRAPVEDDDWDDSPTLQRFPVGLPPRPAIFRDPSPHTATAEQLAPEAEEVVIDTRPIPKPLPPIHAEKRGLDLLPRTYRVTVEDKRRGVDLVPLHRALLGMDGVRDMSLLSYSNGVAIVSLDTLDALDPEGLRTAVARAMSREAKVEVHNEQTMVIKLAEE